MFYNEYLMWARQKELLREAAHYRLISQVQRRSARRKYSFGLALAWLGSRLCKWGSLLQERFSDIETIAPPEAVKSCI